MTVDLLVGDTREVIASIPDDSVALVATSPPFLALRSYLPADHESKQAEIGSEGSPAAFLDALLELTAEWGRVLSPWGSIAVELGDTYSGSGGAGGDYNDKGLRSDQPKFTGSAMSYRKEAIRNRKLIGWPGAKSLALIPQLYAVALAYGVNPLTGKESSAGRWLVRNVITWHRNNPPVGALGDKFRPSTSYIVVATRDKARWFDLTAVRTPAADSLLRPRAAQQNGMAGRERQCLDGSNPAGAPPLTGWFDQHDTWLVNTQPSKLKHYAMWPARLAERLILSMCPRHVCGTCGQPRRRIEQVDHIGIGGVSGTRRDASEPDGNKRGINGTERKTIVASTLGWSDCGHDNYTPGTVLDPFAGTGTTIAVADLHGRHGIGIELNQASLDLYEARYQECARALNIEQPTLDLDGVA